MTTTNTSAINDLRMRTLLETVSGQRNSAQNEVANLKGENAVLTQLLNDQIALNNELKAQYEQLVESMRVAAENKAVESAQVATGAPMLPEQAADESGYS